MRISGGRADYAGMKQIRRGYDFFFYSFFFESGATLAWRTSRSPFHRPRVHISAFVCAVATNRDEYNGVAGLALPRRGGAEAPRVYVWSFETDRRPAEIVSLASAERWREPAISREPL